MGPPGRGRPLPLLRLSWTQDGLPASAALEMGRAEGAHPLCQSVSPCPWPSPGRTMWMQMEAWGLLGRPLAAGCAPSLSPPPAGSVSQVPVCLHRPGPGGQGWGLSLFWAPEGRLAAQRVPRVLELRSPWLR